MECIDMALRQFATQEKLAECCGVVSMAISQWKKRGIPANRVLDFERITGIHCSIIRPDLYPPDRFGGI